MKEGIISEVAGLREDFLSSLYELENNAVDYFNKIAEKFMEISALSSQKYVGQTLKNIQENHSIEKCKKLI